MREKCAYRDQLSILTDIYPGKVTLSVEETARALGLDRRIITAMIERKELPATNVSLGKKNKVYVIPMSVVARISSG